MIVEINERRILYFTVKGMRKCEMGVNRKEKPLSTTGVTKKLSNFWRILKKEVKKKIQKGEGLC